MSKKTHRKYLFFFSSRRRHTISDRDWSSDVCSSDLPLTGAAFPGNQIPASRISPIARAILANTALYPLPNRSVNGVSGNFVGDALKIGRASCRERVELAAYGASIPRNPQQSCRRKLTGNIYFFFQAEDGIRYLIVTGVQTCALPIFR